jgi:hypothetical protein
MVPRVLAVLLITLLSPGVSSLCLADETNGKQFNQQVTTPVHDAVKIRQGTQKQEEQWRDEKEKLVALYEKLESEQALLQGRRNELQESVQAARRRVAEKEKQLTDIDQIGSRIEPFLKNLVAQLRQHVADDLPFLPEERGQRIQRLDELMIDPDVTVSEKYRKVMEALLVEAEYGNTIEVYQQTILVENTEMLVNIFRLGRISLFYQTLDQHQCGVFDVAAGGWKRLPSEYNRDIGAAIEIGSKRKPAELLSLPLGRISVR